MDWNDEQPIYRQIRDRIVELILDSSLAEGEPIPSVRALAADYQINHLTVSKAYQELVNEGLVEKRRGLGMFVKTGAQAQVKEYEVERFMTLELPAFLKRVRQLGIDPDIIIKELLALKDEK